MKFPPFYLALWLNNLIFKSRSFDVSHAAYKSLGITNNNTKFSSLISALISGDISLLPSVLVVSASELIGAAAAYSHVSNQILINSDWLQFSTPVEFIHVMNEELGHHFDSTYNQEDTQFDEGLIFASLLQLDNSSTSHLLSSFSYAFDYGFWLDGINLIPIEQSSLVRRYVLPVASPGRSYHEQRNRNAFSVLKVDGSVVAWGESSSGGDGSELPKDLNKDVQQIFSSAFAFAALKKDGSVFSWGDPNAGGDLPARISGFLKSGVKKLFSTAFAFAALKDDGSVYTWGNADKGGFSDTVAEHLLRDVKNIYSNESAFAALKHDGSVITWGNSSSGGNSESVSDQLRSGVVQIYSTKSAFAALMNNGTVVTWGNSSSGGNSLMVSSKLQSVVSISTTDSAFAALKQDGSVVTWGNSYGGGNSYSIQESLLSDVITISATRGSFAALKKNGSVVTWGDNINGGNSTPVRSELTSNVRDIFSSDVAFAALKNDGSIVTWGNSSGGGDSSLISNHLQSDVISVASTNAAFAALKKDGSVVTWGDSSRGGDSSSVSTVLNVVSGDNLVNEIIANDSAFSARLRDNSVVSWGDPLNGGNNSIVNSLLKTDILAFANPYIDDILGDFSGKTLKPLGESNSDQLINPLSNALLLAGLFSKPATANTLLSDIRLDLNDDGSVGVNDIQLMLRFSFGTFPNISLTDGLLPVESGFPNSTNIVQRLQTLNNI